MDLCSVCPFKHVWSRLRQTLFLLKLKELDLNNVSLFYQSMLKAWQNNFNVNRDLSHPSDWIMGEPLLYNPLIQTRTLSSELDKLPFESGTNKNRQSERN